VSFKHPFRLPFAIPIAANPLPSQFGEWHYEIKVSGQSISKASIMDEHQNPEEAAESGKDHLRAAAGNLKEAASTKVEDIRQAAGQKADELRSAAQGKAQELRGRAESAWSDFRSKAKNWQAEGEAYVRDNPIKAILIALGLGLLLGLLLRR
jgi:ElaB/YqjD/DUF883 family membrane-anchored ribosome-binding protein